MGEKTAISWTDATFNPWHGCAKVSPGCDHCYAERDSARFSGKVLWGTDAERREFGDKHWHAPVAWNNSPFFECASCGARGGDKAVGYQRVCKTCGSSSIAPARRRVFCASMADVFDKNAPEGARDRLWNLIVATPNIDWLLLTKRIGNARAMLPPSWLERGPAQAGWPSNARLGSTVIDQEEYDRDIGKLLALDVPNFLSIEPMLGPIDLRLGGASAPDYAPHRPLPRRIEWVIAGGESGPHARPMSIQWVRQLRDQCAAAGVAFHFKQWGEWAPAGSHKAEEPGRFAFGDYEHDPARFVQADHYPREFTRFGARCTLERVGKKAAGWLLDGVEHKAFPRSQA